MAVKHAGKGASLHQTAAGFAKTAARTQQFGFGMDVDGQNIGDMVAQRMAESEQRRQEILDMQANAYNQIDMSSVDPMGVEENKEKQAEDEKRRLEEMAEAKRKAAEEEAEAERQAKQKMLDELDAQYDILSDRFDDNFEEMNRGPTDTGSLDSLSASSTAAYDTFKANADRATSFQERQAKLTEEQVRLSKSMEKLLKERQLIVGAL